MIRHILTLYRRSKALSDKRPLKFPTDSLAYELRLIDDDETYYTPYYEISALDRYGSLEEFPSLAFCEVRNYSPIESPDRKKREDFMRLQEELKGSKKVALIIHVRQLQSVLNQFLTVTAHEDTVLSDLLLTISKMTGFSFSKDLVEF